MSLRIIRYSGMASRGLMSEKASLYYPNIRFDIEYMRDSIYEAVNVAPKLDRKSGKSR